MNKYIIIISIFLLGSIFSALFIYLTPLRYTEYIPPTIEDIAPTTFYETYVEHEGKEYLLIDVRGETSYNNQHAEGSINMPLHTLYNARETLPREDVEIVLICSGGVASGVGYSYLEHYGFTNIQRIEDGIESWVAAGLPTNSNQ